jgi:hypothetical protein
MIRIGTSGYNYPEWRGNFYPEKFPSGKMLPQYAERFSTVEINYTFYRMPNAKTVAGWDAETPAGSSFTLKAPQRITHFARLREIDEPLRYFLDTAARTGAEARPRALPAPAQFQEGPGTVGGPPGSAPRRDSVASASAAFRVRVWAIMSRGQGLGARRTPPESASVGYSPRRST